jgi:hypothetical protein
VGWCIQLASERAVPSTSPLAHLRKLSESGGVGGVGDWVNYQDAAGLRGHAVQLLRIWRGDDTVRPTCPRFFNSSEGTDINQQHGRLIIMSGSKLFFHLARTATQLFTALQIEHQSVFIYA